MMPMVLPLLLVITKIAYLVRSAELTGLAACPPEHVFNTSVLTEVKLGPAEPSLPYVEGELYKTAGESARIECQLPQIPEDAVLSLTYTTTYVDRMRSAVITHVTKEKAISDTNKKDEGCSFAAFLHNLTETSLAAGLPPRCGNARSSMDSGEIEVMEGNRPFHLSYGVDFERRVLYLILSQLAVNQTGTYQCAILRSCTPAYLEGEEEENQPALAVTKSLFLKVYKAPDYKRELVLASSVLASTAGFFMVTAIIARASGTVEPGL